MDQIQQHTQNVCNVPNHTNKNISIFCIDKKCNSNSRILCQECIMNRKKFHSNCDSFLTFDDLKSNILNLQYTDDSKIKPIFKAVFQTNTDFNVAIDEIYDNILLEISLKIQELKKQTKIKMASKKVKLKEDLQEFIDQQTQLSNLQPLQDEIFKFNQDLITIQKLNQQIIQKQQENVSQSQETKYLQIYNESLIKHDIKEINPTLFENLQKDILNSLELHQLYPQQQQSPIKIKSLQLIPKCESNYELFRKTYYKKSPQGLKFNLMSKPFKRNEKVTFKFRLFEYFNRQFSKSVFAGITTLNDITQNGKNDFYFSKGNQIRFNQMNFMNRGFKKTGEKELPDVCTEGQKFILQVCVEKNQIILMDEQKQCIMENSYDFKDQLDEDWVIVIGDGGYQKQNFKIQIL